MEFNLPLKMKSDIAQGYRLLVDKYNLDSWKNLNSKIAKSLKLESTEVLSFLGTHHALKEISTGLSHLFMHKMAIGVVTGCDYFVDQVSKDFSKLGYKIQSTSASTLKDPKAWVESLSKETLLVLFAEDHPITGEKFETTELRSLLSAKKIFSVGISHRRQFYIALPTKVESYEVKVWSAGSGRAVALLGDRAKLLTPISAHINWDEYSFDSFELPINERKEDKAAVEKFENSGFVNCAPFFKAAQARLYDRAVLVWTDLDASALIDRLKLNLKFSEGSVVTTSPCHWPSPRLVEWMRGNPLSEAEQRGMVVFGLEFLKLEKSVSQINLAREEVLKLQG